MDGGEGARTRALLLLGSAGVDGTLGARENAALGDEKDVAVGELLLELTGKAADWEYLLDPAVDRKDGFEDNRRIVPTKDIYLRTAAGSCGSPGGEGQGRKR